MSVILKRLNQSFRLDLKKIDQSTESTTASIATKIQQMDAPTRQKLILHHAQLHLEYTLSCSKIAKKIASSQHDKNQLDCSIKILLRKAQLLEVIYRDYLYAPETVYRLKNEQQMLQKWPNLSQRALYSERHDLTSLINNFSSSKNIIRLFGSRSKKLLLAITLITDNASTYCRTMKAIDLYAAPFFTHLAWIFFIPRLSINLAMLTKHTISHPWMSDEEKNLGWMIRFRIQWNIRWPELTNDIPWFFANLASAFILIGALAPYGMMLNIVMQCYEVAMAWIQWHLDTGYLAEQRQIYLDLQHQNALPPAEQEDLNEYIQELTDRYQFDNQRLWIPVWNTSVLLLALILALPTLTAISPFFPIAGGLLSVATTIVSYQKRETLKREKNPTQDLFSLPNTSISRFFLPTPQENSEPVHPSSEPAP